MSVSQFLKRATVKNKKCKRDSNLVQRNVSMKPEDMQLW